MFREKISGFAEWMREGGKGYKAQKERQAHEEKLREELKKLEETLVMVERDLNGMGYFTSDRDTRDRLDAYVSDVAKKEAERLEKLKARKAEIESELKESLL